MLIQRIGVIRWEYGVTLAARVAVLTALAATLTSCAQPTVRNAAQDDADMQQRLAKTPRKAEALHWLNIKDKIDRTVGKDNPTYTNADSVRFVKSLYTAGAVKVIAVNIVLDRNMESTRTLIVQMPKSRPQRQQILNIINPIVLAGGFESDPDYGQTYEMIFWD
ncbi:MAG: hypothetical protein JWQ02_2211 [Capsulimonas sp.]|jgi:hypothetical protein|nr:hypothetical protein [Capsulimonas sp.]